MRKKWGIWTGFALGALTLLALVAVQVLRSNWMREQVRLRIIEEAEHATGGRVELGAFEFDWATLTARLDRFTIHGNEEPGQSPLLSVEKAVIGLRIISLLERSFDVRSVDADRPTAHIIVYPDGRTNLPQPKQHRRTPLETVLDLKIGRFVVRNGMVQVDREGESSRIAPWNARGENLSARATYEPLRLRYTTELSIAPLRLTLNGRSIDARLQANAFIDRTGFVIPAATVEAEGITVHLANGRLDRAFTATYRADGKSNTWSGNAEGTMRVASPADYTISGTAHGTAQGLSGTAHFEATAGLVTINDAHVSGFGGEATGSAEVRALDDFRVKGDLRHIHLASLPRRLPYDGYFSGSFAATGNMRGITAGTLNGTVAGPAAHGEISVRYSRSRIEFAHSWMELPHTRVDLTGTLGEKVAVRLHSTDWRDLTPAIDLLAPGKHLPDFSAAALDFDGTVSGPLTNPDVTGHASARGATYSGYALDSVAGDLHASPSSFTLSNASAVYQGIPMHPEVTVELQNWIASDTSNFTAAIDTRGPDITKILTAAGRKDIDITGVLEISSQFAGTLGNPNGRGDIILTRGAFYGQPYDSITGRVQMDNSTTQSITGLLVSGSKRVNMTGRFLHAASTFPAGQLEFNVTSNTMPLTEIATVVARQPDIRGFGKFHADGALRISRDAKHALQFDLLAMNADASANALELSGRNLGDARLTAQTTGDVMTARFDSNAAQASIHGEGAVRLAGDYPVNGVVTFSNAGLNELAMVVLKADPKALNFYGTAEGQATITGAMRNPAGLSAALEVRKLEVHPANFATFSITNNGPLRAVVSRDSIRIESARLVAPQTDLRLSGTAALGQKAQMNLQTTGTINMALAQSFTPDLRATGTVLIDAAVRGTLDTPDFSGRATLQDGSVRYADFANGLTNAAGTVTFSGTRATIQSFTAESGGGRVNASGFAAITGGTVAFRIETEASGVRVRYPEGVSSVSDARLTLAGTPARSQATGAITIHRVAINPKSDAATILANFAQPVRTPAARTGFVENVNLDIQIETAPDVLLETSVTQTVQADANLRLRGTVTNPAVLGRINITQGTLVLFGNRYSITQGAISFYNPVKIDPILNIDLETKARGVDVILTVTGPVGKLNLTYRSDPPLQFGDIIALLATGRAPTDATQAARDTGQSQSFQQLGTSTVLGQAIANPVAGRLQRFFGVSRLKIDPRLSGVTGSPQARLTVEQQVTPDILFTYITDVSSTSTQLIRVEWAYNRNWSAILTREENGYVGLDFAWKKRFR